MAGETPAWLQVGPNIVRAWFDTVINPLLAALEVELDWMGRRAWSWRGRGRRLELIRPIRSHLRDAGRANFEQIEELDPEMKDAAARHDLEAERLREACERLHELLLKLPTLKASYDEATKPTALASLGKRVEDLFGSYPPSAHLEILAEYIVNRSEELPAYYAPAALWNAHRCELLALRDLPETREASQIVDAAGVRLEGTARRAHDLLKDRRRELSRRLDVPYVAPPPREQPRDEQFKSFS